MKTFNAFLIFLLTCTIALGQAGHIMQGVGAVNMSMGGASTAQPIDISGALQWNPAGIATFDHKIVKLDVGLFFSSPELRSTVPVFDNLGQPTGAFFSGVTKDDRGISPMPALAFVWASPESRHSFGFSSFGISGFGVTFPENPLNPINAPQSMGGFGRIESNYMLLQFGISYAYEITDELSVGIQQNVNYAGLELMPNPTSNPTSVGYPSTGSTTSLGIGEQIGIFYNGKSGIKGGVSYKTKQRFQDFNFKNTFLDQSSGENSFGMDYPAILSFGLGYSNQAFDFATDFRTVYYENTDGFDETGWTSTAAVKGFGWNNINILSMGAQYKGIQKLPIRVGYTFSTNPISEEVAFYNVPATAIIKHAFQFGVSYSFGDHFQIDGLYHHGMSDGSTSGPVLNPALASSFPPYGALPGSEVSYDMTTDLIGIGISYHF